MNTITSSLRTTAAILASLVLSATAAFAGESTAAKSAPVAGLEVFSLRTPTLNADGSTTLPDGSVLAAPGHATVNDDGSVTFANGQTISAPTINLDGSITLADGTVVEPAKISASVPGARSSSALLVIESD